MFGRAGQRDLRREVEVEIVYLTKLHGDAALGVAREKAARPNLRSARRRVLEAVVNQLEHRDARPRKKLLGLFG